MKNLYESILSSTGSGKAYLKDYLLKNGWKYMTSGTAIENPNYGAQTQFLKIRDNGSLYVDIYVTHSKTYYRYDIVDLEDLKYVTEYWKFYNNVYLKGFNNKPAKDALHNSYKELRSGLKQRFIRKL